MGKPRKTPGSRIIHKDVLADLNSGSRESANLAEGLAVDFTLLMRSAHPHISPETLVRLSAGKPSITERMRIAGEILLEDFGLNVDEFLEHRSDTVRGWVSHVIGLAPGLTLEERLQRIRPLADDSHFGVREWAWMPLRSHISADVEKAIELLEPWVEEESPYLRRFAVELTRPRGVWTAHIDLLKQQPHLGLPLLRPLKADPEKYVQDSVSNWLNDAAKSQPDWVRELCVDWTADCDDPATFRICRRAVRSLRGNDE
jgi:3-methyladenine DNA glycosylase AlkC